MELKQELLRAGVMAARQCGSNDTDGSLLEFKPVTKADTGILKEFFERHPSRSCDYSVAGILMWTDYFDYKYALENDTLFIKGTLPDTGKTVYYAPLGSMDKAAATAMILRDIKKGGNRGVLVSCEEYPVDEYLGTIAGNASYCDEWKEYVYPVEQFTGFKGKKMEKKRNHLNYFEKHCPGFEIERITPSLNDELIRFTHKFEDTHEYSELFVYEAEKTLEVISRYGEYPFDGIAIRYGGEIIGYTFGEKIGDTFFVHVEKGDCNYNGVYQALSSYMAREVAGKYPDVRYLNREEDMGEPSLKKSKESYHPCMMVCKREHAVTVL